MLCVCDICDEFNLTNAEKKMSTLKVKQKEKIKEGFCGKVEELQCS